MKVKALIKYLKRFDEDSKIKVNCDYCGREVDICKIGVGYTDKNKKVICIDTDSSGA